MANRCTVIVLHNRDPLARYRGVRAGARFVEVVRLPVDAASPLDACRLAAALFGDDEHAATAHPRYAEDVEVYRTNVPRGLRRGDLLVVVDDVGAVSVGVGPAGRWAFAHTGRGWTVITPPTWEYGSLRSPAATTATRAGRSLWRGPLRRRPA